MNIQWLASLLLLTSENTIIFRFHRWEVNRRRTGDYSSSFSVSLAITNECLFISLNGCSGMKRFQCIFICFDNQRILRIAVVRISSSKFLRIGAVLTVSIICRHRNGTCIWRQSIHWLHAKATMWLELRTHLYGAVSYMSLFGRTEIYLCTLHNCFIIGYASSSAQAQPPRIHTETNDASILILFKWKTNFIIVSGSLIFRCEHVFV